MMPQGASDEFKKELGWYVYGAKRKWDGKRELFNHRS
jgi:hypothetical protein